MMNEKLYFIANSGCDATTYGLIRLNDGEFEKFRLFVENLNKNSYYGCMPTISVYEINMSELKIVENIGNDPRSEDYIERDNLFYLDDNIYTFREKYFSYYSELKLVCGR